MTGDVSGSSPVVTVVVVFAVAVLTRHLAGALLPQMERAGFVATNYRGRKLPKAGGAVPILTAAASLLFWLGFFGAPSGPVADDAGRLLLTMFSFGLVGFVDDAAGDRSAGGLGGHWRRLVAGELTTGAVKALFGIAAAFALTASASASLFEWVLHAFLVAGCANGVNLLDLRPGRALKSCLSTAVLLWAVSWRHPVWPAALPAFAAFAAFAPADMSGRAMLGDGGANAVGALLGMTAVIAAGGFAKVVLALAVAVLHAASERGSISTLIENTPFLRHLDEWGRRDGP